MITVRMQQVPRVIALLFSTSASLTIGINFVIQQNITGVIVPESGVLAEGRVSTCEGRGISSADFVPFTPVIHRPTCVTTI